MFNRLAYKPLTEIISWLVKVGRLDGGDCCGVLDTMFPVNIQFLTCLSSKRLTRTSSDCPLIR